LKHAQTLGGLAEREITITHMLLSHIQRVPAVNRIIERETGFRQTLTATPADSPLRMI
jgi:hypothetical protein